jgi:putative ATPase
MLEGGEDPLFIARRMVIFASEDVGNADPRGLQLALNAQQAVDFIGMPEARIVLSQVVIYLAMAPKSRSCYEAIQSALSEVRASGALPVPMQLRNAPTELMRQQGYGKGPKNERLPSQLLGKKFYHPTQSGYEKYFKEKAETQS